MEAVMGLGIRAGVLVHVYLRQRTLMTRPMQSVQHGDQVIDDRYPDFKAAEYDEPPEADPTVQSDSTMQTGFSVPGAPNYNPPSATQPLPWNGCGVPNAAEASAMANSNLMSLTESNRQTSFRYRNPHGPYRWGQG